MAKPATKLVDIRITIRRGRARFGTVSAERQYIYWKPANSRKWFYKSWNDFDEWMTK
jgi:hypothetical protein